MRIASSPRSRLTSSRGRIWARSSAWSRRAAGSATRANYDSMSLADDLLAFVAEQRRCGLRNGGVEGGWVRMRCELRRSASAAGRRGRADPYFQMKSQAGGSAREAIRQSQEIAVAAPRTISAQRTRQRTFEMTKVCSVVTCFEGPSTLRTLRSGGKFPTVRTCSATASRGASDPIVMTCSPAGVTPCVKLTCGTKRKSCGACPCRISIRRAATRRSGSSACGSRR